MSRYIHNLIQQGEHQRLDFKYEISDAKKIARTFSAFANTNGGTLLIGVKDNGNISGVRTDEEEYMAESAAHLYCKPKVDYTVVHHKINDKIVLEIIVPESTQKPYKAPWKDDYKAFVRVEDQNFVADIVLLEVWKIKHRDKRLLVRYKEYEKFLFDLIKNNQRVTLKEFIKLSGIKRHLAIKILSQLIVVKAIDIVVSDKESFFTIFEDLP